MKWEKHIHSDPDILSGKPIITGTRISVDFVLTLYASGWTRVQIKENYPHLTDEALSAVSAYAAACSEAADRQTMENFQHAEPFERLNRAIQSRGGFRLLIAQYSLPQYRDMLVNRLMELHKGSTIYNVVKENPPDFNVLQAELTELAKDSVAIHFIDLGNCPSPLSEHWINALNQRREAIASQCPLPVILWLTGDIIRAFALNAPDMWAWRAGVFDFSVL